MTDPVLRWPEVNKDPDDTLSVSLGIFGLCAQFWTPNEEYVAGEFVWPRITVIDGQIVKGPTGFVMECTTPGRTATKEPRWTSIADVPMPADGSVIWTPRVGLAQGIAAATAAVVTGIFPSDGTTNDFICSAVVVNEGTKLLVDYSGGTVDLAYEVEFTFTIGGRQRVGRQLVNIVKK